MSAPENNGPDMGIGYDVATALWQGKRPYQEDTLLADFHGGMDRGFAVLADGMGGHAAGDLASRLVVIDAVSHLKFLMHDGASLEKNLSAELISAIETANDVLKDRAADDRRVQGMGATFLATVMFEDRLYWASVGDSPLYLWREGRLRQLNEDHSMAPVIDQMAASGEITEEEAANHPDRNALTSVLMGRSVKSMDVPKTATVLDPGDVLIQASDGLQYLDDAAISAVLEGLDDTATSRQIADALMTALHRLDDPSQDNTAILVLQLTQSPIGGGGSVVTGGATATSTERAVPSAAVATAAGGATASAPVAAPPDPPPGGRRWIVPAALLGGAAVGLGLFFGLPSEQDTPDLAASPPQLETAVDADVEAEVEAPSTDASPTPVDTPTPAEADVGQATPAPEAEPSQETPETETPPQETPPQEAAPAPDALGDPAPETAPEDTAPDATPVEPAPEADADAAELPADTPGEEPLPAAESAEAEAEADTPADPVDPQALEAPGTAPSEPGAAPEETAIDAPAPEPEAPAAEPDAAESPVDPSVEDPAPAAPADTAADGPNDPAPTPGDTAPAPAEAATIPFAEDGAVGAAEPVVEADPAQTAEPSRSDEPARSSEISGTPAQEPTDLVQEGAVDPEPAVTAPDTSESGSSLSPSPEPSVIQPGPGVLGQGPNSIGVGTFGGAVSGGLAPADGLNGGTGLGGLAPQGPTSTTPIQTSPAPTPAPAPVPVPAQPAPAQLAPAQPVPAQPVPATPLPVVPRATPAPQAPQPVPATPIPGAPIPGVGPLREGLDAPAAPQPTPALPLPRVAPRPEQPQTRPPLIFDPSIQEVETLEPEANRQSERTITTTPNPGTVQGLPPITGTIYRVCQAQRCFTILRPPGHQGGTFLLQQREHVTEIEQKI